MVGIADDASALETDRRRSRRQGRRAIFRDFVLAMPRRWPAVLTLCLFSMAIARAVPADQVTVEALKARMSSASLGDRPRLCVEIAEKELDQANKLYAGDDVEKAQAALTDVVAYCELARDYAIQSHKYQKQSEIAVRGMSRKLTNLLHSLGHEDQSAVQNAVSHLERVRDDLLASMFKKGNQ